MKKFLNIFTKIFVVLLIAILAIVILIFQINSEKVPEAYVYTPTRTVLAVRGNYTWNAFSEVLSETRYVKDNYVFKTDNTLLVSPQERFTISNSQNSNTTRHKFEEKNVFAEKSNGERIPVSIENVNYNYQDKNFIELVAPEEDDTYYYYFTLDYFEKGVVDYGVKVIVSSEQSYDIEQLQKFKNTSLVDFESINEIISILPYSRNKTNLTIQSTTKPAKLIVNYSEIALDREIFLKNALAMFILIPEAEIVEYNSSETSYTFTRSEIEHIYERHLSDYAENTNLWESEVFYGEKIIDENTELHQLFSTIILSALDINSGDRTNAITINTKSFEENTFYDVDGLQRELILSDLSKNFDNIYDMSYDNYKAINQSHYYVEAEPIVVSGDLVLQMSGDIILSGESTEQKDEVNTGSIGESESNPLTLHNNEVKLLVKQGNEERRFLFKCFYVNSNKKWMFYKEELK